MAIAFEGAGKVGSDEELRKTLAESSTDGTWIKFIPKDEKITVRFLEEPDEWFKFYEHYGQSVNSYYACIGLSNGCPGCSSSSDQDQRVSKRFLANALLVNTGQVVPLKLPVDLVNRLVTRYDRYQTMKDRDYTLWRTGSGLNTVYDLDAESPDALDLDQYKDQLHDQQEVLEKQFESAWSDKPKAPKEQPSEVAGTPVDNEGVEDTEEEVLTENEIREMNLIQLAQVASKLELDVPDDVTRESLIDLILGQAQ